MAAEFYSTDAAARRRAAGLEHAEEGDDVVRRVGQVQAHVHAGAHAQPLKARRGAVGELLQPAIAVFATHELERRALAPLGRRVVEEMF
jgi:hypothetical protein